MPPDSPFIRLKLKLNGVEVLIPADAVRRVLAKSEITHIPGSASWLLGYVQTSQSFVPLVDPSQLLKQGEGTVQQWVELEPEAGWPHWCLAVAGSERLKLDDAPTRTAARTALCAHGYQMGDGQIDELDPEAFIQIPEVVSAMRIA